jgi:hypothetical protein
MQCPNRTNWMTMSRFDFVFHQRDKVSTSPGSGSSFFLFALEDSKSLKVFPPHSQDIFKPRSGGKSNSTFSNSFSSHPEFT